MMNMLDLPDSILLEVFSYLPANNLCKCAEVCQRFCTISKDITLKRNISIEGKISSPQFEKFLLQFGSPEMKSLRVKIRKVSMNIETLDLNYLKQSCPNLQNFEINNCCLLVFLGCLPLNLTRLCCFHCEFPYGLRNLQMTMLKHLDLSYSDTVTSGDLYCLKNLTSLTSLFLTGCPRINNGGIEYIVDFVPNIETLDLEGTDVLNEGITMVLKNCSKLKRLFIGSTSLGDNCILDCKVSLKLREICIYNTFILPSVAENVCKSVCYNETFQRLHKRGIFTGFMFRNYNLDYCSYHCHRTNHKPLNF